MLKSSLVHVTSVKAERATVTGNLELQQQKAIAAFAGVYYHRGSNRNIPGLLSRCNASTRKYTKRNISHLFKDATGSRPLIAVSLINDSWTP